MTYRLLAAIEKRMGVDVDRGYGQFKADLIEAFQASRKDISEQRSHIMRLAMLPGMDCLIYAGARGFVSGTKT
jgi:hypothetical protein